MSVSHCHGHSTGERTPGLLARSFPGSTTSGSWSQGGAWHTLILWLFFLSLWLCCYCCCLAHFAVGWRLRATHWTLESRCWCRLLGNCRFSGGKLICPRESRKDLSEEQEEWVFRVLIWVVAGQVFWWPHDLPDVADMGKQRVVLLGEAVSRHCIEASFSGSSAQPADSLWFLSHESLIVYFIMNHSCHTSTTIEATFLSPPNSHSQTPAHRFWDLSALVGWGLSSYIILEVIFQGIPAAPEPVPALSSHWHGSFREFA